MSNPKSKKDQLDKFIEDLNQWVLNIMSGDLTSRIENSYSKDLKKLSILQ